MYYFFNPSPFKSKGQTILHEDNKFSDHRTIRNIFQNISLIKISQNLIYIILKFKIDTKNLYNSKITWYFSISKIKSALLWWLLYNKTVIHISSYLKIISLCGLDYKVQNAMYGDLEILNLLGLIKHKSKASVSKSQCNIR